MYRKSKKLIEHQANELYLLGMEWDDAWAEASKPVHPLKELTHDDLRDEMAVDPGYLVGNADHPVLLANALWMTFGPEKTGKTYHDLELAFCIAFGITYYGLPVKEGNVEYVIAEGGIGRIAKRIYSLCDKYKDALAAKGFHTYADIIDAGKFNIMGSAVNLLKKDAENGIDQMLEQMKHPPYVGLWLDTWARMLAEVGGHASDPDVIAPALRRCDDLRDVLDCTVTLVAHTPLASNGRPKGMGEQQANLDGATMCTKLGGGAGEVFTFKSAFQRHGANDVAMAFLQERLGLDRVFRPADGEFADSKLAVHGVTGRRAIAAIAMLRTMEPLTGVEAWRDAAIAASLFPGKNPRQQWSEALALLLKVDAVVVEQGIAMPRAPKIEPKGDALYATDDGAE
jgi:hypothetical protein